MTEDTKTEAGSSHLDSLEAVAMAATQGDWEWREEFEPLHMRTLSPGVLVLDNDAGCGGPWGDEIDRANATYFITFRPSAVLSLIEQVRSSTREVERLAAALRSFAVYGIEGEEGFVYLSVDGVSARIATTTLMGQVLTQLDALQRQALNGGLSRG